MLETSSGAKRSVFAVAIAFSLSITAPVAADILIVSSNAPGLQPGMQLADSAQLDVPAGAKVRLLLPSGATLSVYGPASRPVKDVTKGEPIVESVWAKAKEMLATGGVDQSRPGATRGIVITQPPQAPAAAWNIISASANGNVCVEKGARLMLVRPAGGSGPREATLVETSSKASAPIAWPDKATQTEWPTALPPKSASTYQITSAGAAMREIRLRVIEKRELGDTIALRALLQNDCQQQARILMQ